jgi:hypothetical protein
MLQLIKLAAMLLGVGLLNAYSITHSLAQPPQPIPEKSTTDKPNTDKPNTDKPTDQLKIQQSQLATQYANLEEVFLRMSEIEAASNPTRAGLLMQAAQMSKQLATQQRMLQAGDLLGKGQFSRAIPEMEASKDNLKKLLELLQSENRSSRIKDERKMLEEVLKDIRRIENIQRATRGRTENGQETQSAANDQKDLEQQLQNAEKDLADKKEKSDTQKDTSQKDAGQKDGAQKDGAQKDGAQKDGAQKDGAQKDGAQKEGAQKDGAQKEGAQKEGAQKEDSQKNDAEKSKSEPKDSNPTENPDPSMKDPQQNDKPNENNPNNPQDKNKDQNTDQQNESQQSESQQSDEEEQSDSADRKPKSKQEQARDRVQKARKRMQKAEKNLRENKRKDAVEEQEKAEEELQQAIAELEKILKQLREEEIERTLVDLETRLKRMAEWERTIRDQSEKLANLAGEDRDRQLDIQANKLATEQLKVAMEGQRAMLLLKDEGSSQAFPEALQQVINDAQLIVKRLNAADLSVNTLAIEDEVIGALDEMLESLQEVQKKREEEKQNQRDGGGSGGGGEPEEPLVGKIAELRLIKTLQLRVNRRTDRLADQSNNKDDLIGEVDDQKLREELLDLSSRQQKIQGVTRDILLEASKK